MIQKQFNQTKSKQEYTILRYSKIGGTMKPTILGAGVRSKHAKDIYERETSKLVKDGWKLVSFTKSPTSRERMFRSNQANLILKLIEVV